MAEEPRVTAPKVNERLDDHLQEHALRFNIKLHDVYHAVFGEQGKGGICTEVSDLKTTIGVIDTRLSNIEDYLKWLVRLVLGAVILAVLGLIFVKIQ